MRHRFLLIYTWLVRVLLFFLPDIPFIMRIRGFLYSFAMKSCGKNFQVAHNVILNSLEGMSVGNNVYFAMNNVIFAHGNLYIGDDVMFGPSCVLTTGNHSYMNGSYRFGAPIEQPVVINDGAWVGANCVILPGAVLPAKSVLGAGAVLTSSRHKDEGIYVGIPAKMIKSRV